VSPTCKNPQENQFFRIHHIKEQEKKTRVYAVVTGGRPTCKLNNSVAHPDPGSGSFLTTGSGMGDPDPGSGMNNPRELRNNLLGLNYLNSLMRIRDGKYSDPG
jgi:hypothetical protein